MFDKLKQKLADNAVLIDESLSKYFQSDNAQSIVLNNAQIYGLLSGGKKIRGFLVLELCRILGGNIKAAIPYACAIEMMHASSLIHDDMPCMDNDDIRRGKPSTHKAFGETAALLAGDSLMVKAFSAISDNSALSSEINLKAISVLAFSSGDQGMLAGQGIDMLADSKISDINELIHLHSLKTGRLISASAQFACLAAGITEDDTKYQSSIKYAEDLGLAFQIIDDILDYKEGKIEENSFLSFMSYEQARQYAQNLTNSAIDSIHSIDDGTLVELAEFLTVREY